MTMDADNTQLKRNRAKVFMIAAGLFLIGSQGPDIGDLFDDHHDERRQHIVVKMDRIDQAAEEAADFAERAALLAERAAEAAERASERR
jgi:hypothetical protein